MAGRLLLPQTFPATPPDGECGAKTCFPVAAPGCSGRSAKPAIEMTAASSRDAGAAATSLGDIPMGSSAAQPLRVLSRGIAELSFAGDGMQVWRHIAR